MSLSGPIAREVPLRRAFSGRFTPQDGQAAVDLPAPGDRRDGSSVQAGASRTHVGHGSAGASIRAPYGHRLDRHRARGATPIPPLDVPASRQAASSARRTRPAKIAKVFPRVWPMRQCVRSDHPAEHRPAGVRLVPRTEGGEPRLAEIAASHHRVAPQGADSQGGTQSGAGPAMAGPPGLSFFTVPPGRPASSSALGRYPPPAEENRPICPAQ